VLQDVEPAVTRSVEVPGEASLAELHEVAQVAMGWTNSHLHEFDIDGDRYGLPAPGWDADQVGDEAKVKLFRLVEQGGQLGYVYAFGDNWDHIPYRARRACGVGRWVVRPGAFRSRRGQQRPGGAAWRPLPASASTASGRWR
jgi:hypothetical protein